MIDSGATAAEDNERRSRALLGALRQGVCALDRAGRIVDVNPRLCEMSGLDAGDLIGTRVAPRRWPSGRRGGIFAVLARAVRNGPGSFDTMLQRDGADPCGVAVDVSEWDDGGRIAGLLCVVHDMRAAAAAGERIADAEAVLGARSERLLAAWEWDAQTDVVRFASDADGGEAATGADPGLADVLSVMPSPYRETLEQGVRGVATGRSAFDLRHPVVGPDGPLWAETRIRPWRDLTGDPRGVRASTRDVDAELHARWATERSRDLYRTTLDTLDAHVAVLDAEGVIVATNAAWDRFAEANEGCGVGVGSHYLAACDAAADEPLAADVARALREIIAGARREFVAEYPCHARHEQRWFTMRAALAEAGGAVRVVVHHQDVTSRRLRAERELRAARDGVRAADATETERTVAGIRDALRLDRFVLHAQPIVDVRTGATVQHELLIRMLAEDGRLVVPSSFLPVAERHGLIRAIDRWVVRHGLAFAGRGHAVQLNVSAESLGDRSLAPFVEAELGRASADPARVVFELTETALLRDADAAEDFLRHVRELGCKVALDDFGTGYGGFVYLKRLPVDFLKIDIEFVRDLPHHPASQHVVEAVVSLARGFGIGTIAEGVEDDETLALLERFGVGHAQGFGIHPPAPATDLL